MIVPNTLRGRLLVALSLVFALALLAATALDRNDGKLGQHLFGMLAREPYQDGLVLGVFSLPALGLIWLVSSWSLRPLARASAEAKRAGPQNPAARITHTGLPAEIAPLVDAVNGALDRMAAGMEAERRFTENAAHELRTPLAVLRLRLQRAREAQAAPFDWAPIEQDLARMQRLVSQLLDLARKEHAGRDANPEHAPVNLARLAREAAAMIQPLAQAQGRRLTVSLPETLIASGAADDLRDALRNLLENALLHGSGTITLHGAPDGDQAILSIEDEGAGITPELRARAFDRFGKGARTEGSGLGLSIVQAVAQAHGGSVGLLPGATCRVQLKIPVG